MPIIGIIDSAKTGNIGPANSFYITGSFPALLVASTDGITWSTPQTTVPTNALVTNSDYGFNQLKYLNGGYRGKISETPYLIASTDGITYTNSTTVTNMGDTYSSGNINAFAYGNGRYIAGSNHGMQMSTDFITWTFPTVNNLAFYNATRNVAASSSLYVAVNQTSQAGYQVAYSTNGTTWTLGTIASTHNFFSINWNGTYFVAGGQNGSTTAPIIYYSTNAVTWTNASGYSGTGNQAIYSIYNDGSGKVVSTNASATTSNALQYSTNNGVTWTVRTVASSAYLSTVFWGNGTWVAGTWLQTSTNIFTSTDAITWTARTLPVAITVYDITYDGSKFIITNGNGRSVYYSTNAITWSAATTPSQMGFTNPRTFKYLNRNYVWIDVTQGTTIAYSTDATTWNTASVGTQSVQPLAAIYGGGYYVLGAGGGNLYVSTNLSTWTTRTSANTGDTGTITSVAYGNNLYITVGSASAGGGLISSSTDTVTWTTRLNPGYVQRGVIYANNQFVSVGNNQSVITSTNGITWTTRITTGTETYFSVAYGNGVYVLCGAPNIIRSSTDAITWTTQTSPLEASCSLYTVAYKNNLFVVTGSMSYEINPTMQYATSTNGVTWTSRTVTSLQNGNSYFSYNTQKGKHATLSSCYSNSRSQSYGSIC